MHEFDRLPFELRAWLASAVLPWSPRSARRAYSRALSRTQDKHRALDELDHLQRRMIARDVQFVWGPDHPLAAKDATQ